ncbi:acrosin-like [Protopterus annectens]|uniref:acrosin-like n=1 Tax=Protopterus annectens TaxID=7888 RepID=UPI001CFB3DD1|nr:acrosin-like [Protopterus annectens]
MIPGKRVLGGRDALPGAWPWQVSVQHVYENTNAKEHICGGSVINREWVASAAHCFHKGFMNHPEKFRIVTGINKLSEIKDASQLLKISKIIMHEEYSESTTKNDIALIKLVNPISYTDYVQPVCIPSIEETQTLDLCFVSGWGHFTREGSNPDSLQEGEVDLFGVDVCNEFYWGVLARGMFCAGKLDGSVDACRGDSGGPLSCFDYNDKKFFLVGVTSWGIGCGTPGFPGIYTNISDYKEWIEAKLKEDDPTNFGITWNAFRLTTLVLTVVTVFV